MKRFAILVLAVAMVGFAGQAWAGVQGSAHDVISAITALTNFGACSSCHIPHKSQGDRLWPAAIGGGAPERGEVGNLCTYCHDSGVSVIQRAAQDQVFKDLDTSTHGLIKANALGDTIDTTLPYGAAAAGTTIQCTSCHNVHDQAAAGRMAFLQDDIDVLCARCHQRRQWVGTQFTPAEGAWGSRLGFDPLGTAGNPGSHPIGTDTTGDGSRHDINGTPASLEADSPIETGVIGIVAYGSAATYNLGPKLIGGVLPADASTFTGGMTCVSCHAVHGINTAADGPTAGTPANPDLLAVNQSEMNGSANGGQGTDLNNALCEACHRNAAQRMGSTTSYPNPGATVASHPVDDIYNMLDAGVDPAVVTTTLGWPTGSSGANAAGPDIICESCHMPHPLAAANGAQTTPPLAGSNSHILRNTDAAVCGNCHTGQVADHHPIGNGEMDGTLFIDNPIGDGDSDLECADCHNGNGAHNWTAMGAVGLDPDWEPWDNCRGANDVAGNQCENMSKECMDCHLPAVSRFSPTRPETPNANEYQDGAAMDASHFVGTPSVTLDTWALVDTTAVTGGTTFVDGTWASTGWSRFAGSPTGAVTSAGQLVCESCHELEPGKNATGSDLLLHPYQEALSEDRSYFCQGCHGLTGVSGNAHPQTGDTVGRATLAGRGAPATLITTPLPPALPTPPALTDSFAEWGDRGAAWYPAADQMNCNTCHQPHDAVTTSGTYILESTTGTTLAEITGTPDTAITMFGRSWTNRRYVTHATPLNYQNFCNLCHRSGQ